MGKTGQVVASIVLFFGAAKVALADSVSDIVVPPELGQVSQLHSASSTDPSTKLLILIQDAHVNYQAQKHLAGIVDWLTSRYGVKLVLVEGGEGDVSLSYLRGRGSKAVREQVAEEYLQSGVLSGEEYLDIVSEHPLILWGVDDPALYEAHLGLFLEVERLREATGEDLSRLRQVVDQLKAKGTNEALQKFEAIQDSFEGGKLGFSEYVASLRGESERLGIALTDSPNIRRMVTATRLEAELDPARVSEEQRQAIARLRNRAPQQELDTLRDLAEQLKAGQIEPVTFYQKLESLMEDARLDRAGFPHLTTYIRYVRLKARLQLRALRAELADAHRQIRRHLVGSSDEEEVVSMADRVALCQRLLTLDWTPEDYQTYRQQPDRVQVSRWLPALRAHAARLGVAFDWQADPAALDGALARAVRFYELATVRDAELLRRTLAKMDAEGQRVAVLIAGGFHTDNLIERLASQPVHVVVVTPVVGREEDETRYARILKAKYNR